MKQYLAVLTLFLALNLSAVRRNEEEIEAISNYIIEQCEEDDDLNWLFTAFEEHEELMLDRLWADTYFLDGGEVVPADLIQMQFYLN